MHPLLAKLLQKRKIEDITEMSSDEKADFERWQKILSDGEVTVPKIQEFCEHQIGQIEAKWRDMDNKELKNDRLIVMHTVYKSILNMITGTKAEKESLEKYLNSLIE